MRAIRSIVFCIFAAGLVVSLSGTVFFSFKIRERERLLDRLIQTALPSGGGAEESALRLSDEIYRQTRNPLPLNDMDWYSRWESTSAFNVTSAVSLRYGGFGVEGHSTYGACGTMSRTLLNALWKLGVPARKLQLLANDDGLGGGHTMVEFRSDGRWLVISPSDRSFVWRKPDGSIATANEIRGDHLMFAQIFEQDPRYPYMFDNTSNIRWEKLPGPVSGAFRIVLGEDRYAAAVTPKLYDKPRTFFVILFGISAALSGVGTLITRPRSLRDRRAEK
jgi:hypothetical protein